MEKDFKKIIAWIIFLVFLDQFSKYLVQKFLLQTYPLISGLLELEYSENAGIAFGIRFPYTALLILNFILIAVIIYVFIYEFKLSNKICRISLSLILSGALGNLIDRLYMGYVIDFISIWRWPNFNLADAYISIGILLIIGFCGRIKRNFKKI